MNTRDRNETTAEPPGKISDPPRTVAILRALQPGDLLCSVPAFRTLRTAFPHAHVAHLS